jgi:hypothetical protein
MGTQVINLLNFLESIIFIGGCVLLYVSIKNKGDNRRILVFKVSISVASLCINLVQALNGGNNMDYVLIGTWSVSTVWGLVKLLEDR